MHSSFRESLPAAGVAGVGRLPGRWLGAAGGGALNLGRSPRGGNKFKKGILSDDAMYDQQTMGLLGGMPHARPSGLTQNQRAHSAHLSLCGFKGFGHCASGYIYFAHLLPHFRLGKERTNRSEVCGRV